MKKVRVCNESLITNLICYKKIEEYFRYKTGITFQKKFTLFYFKINEIMRRIQINDCYDFFAEIEKNDEIFLLLLQELVVSQSYFFREKTHFEILNYLIQKNYIFYPKILSVPCACGEEPYSIAINLFECCCHDFHIDAIDINPKAIQKAKAGFYVDRELKYIPTHLKDRYFLEQEEGYKVIDSIKSNIRFLQANLFEKNFPENKYDFVFCRNLFIYLEDSKKEKALDIFYQILKPNGYLFLSFSDYLKNNGSFAKIIVNNKIIYQKVDM